MFKTKTNLYFYWDQRRLMQDKPASILLISLIPNGINSNPLFSSTWIVAGNCSPIKILDFILMVFAAFDSFSGTIILLKPDKVFSSASFSVTKIVSQSIREQSDFKWSTSLGTLQIKLLLPKWLRIILRASAPLRSVLCDSPIITASGSWRISPPSTKPSSK